MLELVLRLAFDARLASFVGAALAGHPELGPRLVEVCVRESRGCQAWGVHDADARSGPGAWWDAVQVEWLEPHRCEWHTLDAGPWSTSGPYGMIRAYSVRMLPAWMRCAPVEVLDVPIVAAYVATRRAASPMCARVPRCVSWWRS